ncbi:MAG: hypothetical protein CYPHOPRED_004358 [Cyphobasidiales sp. Tagirdzhanova-0007]|nr:MAG: hypothetical protein CYPHOPRED_004358 [Cyphobasidiales sp. Tagirdzhanova-0007]
MLKNNPIFLKFEGYQRKYAILLDRSTPQTLYRWLFTLGSALLFVVRIYFAEAYYIITYALGIYLLNLFLAFLQPKFDPSLEQDLAEQDVEEGAPGLPTSSTPKSNGGGSGRGDKEEEEFRPFIRRLPEFQFWLGATKAIIISFVATLFPFLDIPVYAPILLVYFCVLFAITMRRQFAHMRRYRYLPFDIGRKTRYTKG